jgi:hypothetical protein
MKDGKGRNGIGCSIGSNMDWDGFPGCCDVY